MSWFLIFFSILSTVSCSVLRGRESSIALPVVILDNGDPEVHNITTELAASLLNSSSSILPGNHLQLLWREGWCGPNNPALGLAPFPVAGALWGPREENPPIVGVIGPTCSSSALFLGSLLGRDETAPINIHMAHSHLLESREKYPKSFGIVSSSRLLFHASIELMRMNNWRKVSVLYDESHLYHSSALYDTDQSLQDNFTVIEYFISASHLTYIPLNESKRESRVIFLFMNEDLVRRVLCLALHTNVSFPAYQFVIANIGYTKEVLKTPILFTHGRNRFTCLETELNVAFSGTVFVGFSTDKTSVNSSNWTPVIGDQLVPVLDAIQRGQAKRETLYYLDALLSLALAINNSQSENFTITDAMSFRKIRQSLLQLQFDGFSGPVSFSETPGFVDREVLIHQVLEGNVTLIATYGHKDRLMVKSREGLFIASEIRVVDIVSPYSPPFSPLIAYVIFIITFAVTALLVISHFLTLWHRHSKQVKASSWKVLQLAFVGNYLLVLSTVAHTILVGFFPEDVETRCYLWHVIFVSLSVGFTFVEGTMCMLTWRLYRIFVAYKNPGGCLSNKSLISLVLSCIVVTASVSIVQVTADPLRPVVEPSSVRSTLTILRNANNSIVGIELVRSKFFYCNSRVSPILWSTIQNALNIVLSLVTCIFVYLTRNIPIKQFKTVRLIRLNYIVKGGTLLMAYTYGVLTLNITTMAVLIRFIMYTLMLNAINLVIWDLLYLPPLYSHIHGHS